MVGPLLLSLAVLAADCEVPPALNVDDVHRFAVAAQSLSASLDAVARWCDSEQGSVSASPDGECAKAVHRCHRAQAAMDTSHRQSLLNALTQMEAPHFNQLYQPRRSGLTERPLEGVDCEARERTQLTQQARAHLSWARLAQRAHSEYANFRTWCYAQSLNCRQTKVREAKDLVQRKVEIDLPTAPVPLADALDAGAPEPSQVQVVPLGGPTTERQKALASAPLEKWKYLAQQQSALELDADYVSGFVVSRELRDCHCSRPVPAEMVRRFELNEQVRPQESDDEKLTLCQLCVLDAFPRWKTRVRKQCALALELSEFELKVLELSDDGNGLPPHCLQTARQRLNPTTEAYLIVKAPEVALPTPDVRAPVLPREEGRVYVKLFTSSACVTEVFPGPMLARTGDVFPVPVNAKEVVVRGPCGGVAEVYFGKEEKPRASESFGENQPLRLHFGAP
jgi:hypothetical protein